MKKTLTTGLMMVLSAAILSACGTDGAINAASLGGSDNTFSQLSLKNNGAASNVKGFRSKMGAQKEGPQGAGPNAGLGLGFAFGSFSELNLTDAQKAEIQSIMEAAKANQPKRPTAAERPAAPDAAAAQAAQAKISAAFLSDSFDATALHAELESLRPQGDNKRPDPAVMELARAQQTLDIWNVLSAEQKATVSTKAAEFASKMAEMEANRPAAPAKPDPQALITLLNSGSATAESIAALHTRPAKVDHNPLTALETLHSALTAEQRQSFVDSGLLKQPGHGGPKNHPGMGQRLNIQFDAP